MPNDWKSGKWGHLWRTRHPKKIVWFQLALASHVQRASKDEWAKYEPFQMRLAGCTAVAIRVKTPICSKLSTLKTACLNLPSRPQPPRGLVYTWSSQICHSLLQTRLALPSLHIFTWNPSPCKPCIFGLHQVHTRFTSLLLGAHAGSPRARNDADNSLWHARDAKKHVSGWIQ